MKVKIKLVDKSIPTSIPIYSRAGDCAVDLVATSITETADYLEFSTNLSIEIPDGFVGILAPRSSISKYDLTLCNSIGILDVNFRGEIKARFKVVSRGVFSSVYKPLESYKVGDRICQLMILPLPKLEFDLVEELSDTERGSGAFGSSGK